MTHDDYAPAAHYDRVTRAWALLLGEELHYGYFPDGDEPLAVGTAELTSQMIRAADLRADLDVLDVGCGVGTPARRLAREFGVRVLGITTSAVGVATATELTENAGVPGVRFEVRDGTDNGLPDRSFDRVWVMESSHLMADRQALHDECARVLRPGGRLVLCDIIRRRDVPFEELRARRADFAVLRAAFGAARMDTLHQYRGYAERAGFGEVVCADITQQTLPTFDRWKANLDEHRAEVSELIGEQGAADFDASTSILRRFWQDGTLGYGLMSAVRSERTLP